MDAPELAQIGKNLPNLKMDVLFYLKYNLDLPKEPFQKT